MNLLKKNKELIIESIFFIIISFIAYIYLKKNNPDNIIEQYYMNESDILYNLFKISSLIIKITLIFNIKFIILIIIKSYIF